MLLGNRGRAKDAFFGGLDEMPAGADLADETGADLRVADTLLDFIHEHVGKFVAVSLFDNLRITEIPIPATAHEHVDLRCLRDTDERLGIASDFIERDVADGLAAATRERFQFLDDQFLIINDELVSL
jgi:hypothetical protein